MPLAPAPSACSPATNLSPRGPPPPAPPGQQEQTRLLDTRRGLQRHTCLRAQRRTPAPSQGQRRTRWSSHSDPSLGPPLDIILGGSHIFSQESPSQSYRRGPEPVFLKGLRGPKVWESLMSMNLSPQLILGQADPSWGPCVGPIQTGPSFVRNALRGWHHLGTPSSHGGCGPQPLRWLPLQEGAHTTPLSHPCPGSALPTFHTPQGFSAHFWSIYTAGLDHVFLLIRMLTLLCR